MLLVENIFKNNIPKEVETKLAVQSTLWAVIENMFFGALVCTQITTGIYCWDNFKRSNPKYRLLFFVKCFMKKVIVAWFLDKHVVPNMVCVWLNAVCFQNRNPKHRLVVMQWFWFAMQ